MAESRCAYDWPVFQGGPVQRERGFVLHQPAGSWDSVLQVTDQIGVATSRDILSAVAEGIGPDRTFIALGYAGWGPGQLENEILQNSWLTVPASCSLVFETPYHQRWAAAAESIGVDPASLSLHAGNA